MSPDRPLLRTIVLSVALAVPAVVSAAPASATSVTCPVVYWGSLPKAAPSSGPTGSIFDVRTGEHSCYDRIVVDVNGSDPVGYDVRYVDNVYIDASGDPVTLAGSSSTRPLSLRGSKTHSRRRFVRFSEPLISAPGAADRRYPTGGPLRRDSARSTTSGRENRVCASSGGFGHSHRCRRNNTHRIPLISTISPMAAGYPKFQLSSGMSTKFMPYTPATTVQEIAIVA